jgi:hypothetical protein
MKGDYPVQRAERLFPFALRSRIVMVGREALARNKSRLQFVLVSRDLSETSQSEILSSFRHYPIVQLYTSPEIERLFGTKGTKVIGFAKSALAQSLYAELRMHRINRPNPTHGAATRKPA